MSVSHDDPGEGRPGRQLTVLHVVDTLDTGGAEHQLAVFLRWARKDACQHVVCALAGGGRFEEELVRGGVPVYNLRGGPRARLLASAVRLARVVDAVRPDVIHATLYRPGVTARVVGRWKGIPVLTSLVNTTYEPAWRLDNPRLTPWKIRVVQGIDRATARLRGTWYVAITESVKTSAVRQLGIPPERIVVIPRGVVPEEWGHADDAGRVRQELGWAGRYPVVLNVGRLVPQKGQQYLVRAMAAVVERFPHALAVVVGAGRLRGLLEALIRELRLEDHVRLMGQRVDVARLLQAADIFAFPSLFEGLGNALLEAMASGRPCVCSDIPPLREVTDDGRVAVLVAPRTPAALAAAVIRLAEEPAAARDLGEHARAWVRARYDVRQAAAAVEALYRRIAVHAGRARAG
jgi:glycosyltransferase involved in cell wall biosynthesis